MWNKIVFKYGTFLSIGLILYYFFMQLIGLNQRFDFRMFNAIIQAVVLYGAIKTYAKFKPDEFNYLSGTIIGVNTSVVGALIFAIFQMINLYLSPGLLAVIRENAPVIGPYINPFSGGLIIFMEGLAVGLVLSYIIMRLVDLQMHRENNDQLEGV